MGVNVVEATAARVCLRFPLTPNLNHHGTAFGGSLSAAGILSGWAMLQLRLEAEGITASTVVADSRTRYLAPIDQDFEAEAIAPPPDQWAAFLDALERWGRARIVLQTQIRPAGTTAVPAVIHEGIFVAIRPQSPATSQ